MNTSLAFTISPPRRSYANRFKNPNLHYYLDDVQSIRSILNYNRIKRYIVYPEFSDKGRLHYHGILSLDHNEYTRFMKHAQFKLEKLGLLDYKPLRTFHDKIKWVIYISKSWGFTRDILELKSPLLKDSKEIQVKLIEQRSTLIDYFSDNKSEACSPNSGQI